MGWASGSSLFYEVIPIIKHAIPDKKKRVSVYLKLIDAFRNHDWDTLDECLGADPAYDAAYKKIYPEEKDDE